MLTSRDDESVLGESRVHALLEKLARPKQRFEPAADDAKRAVRHERRACQREDFELFTRPEPARLYCGPPLGELLVPPGRGDGCLQGSELACVQLRCTDTLPRSPLLARLHLACQARPDVRTTGPPQLCRRSPTGPRRRN